MFVMKQKEIIVPNWQCLTSYKKKKKPRGFWRSQVNLHGGGEAHDGEFCWSAVVEEGSSFCFLLHLASVCTFSSLVVSPSSHCLCVHAPLLCSVCPFLGRSTSFCWAGAHGWDEMGT